MNKNVVLTKNVADYLEHVNNPRLKLVGFLAKNDHEMDNDDFEKELNNACNVVSDIEQEHGI